ncbi:MAG: alpha/beta fold hydrolase [Saprospiraceae bacterium]|nr:alpha/beta fold hydrolase [Saprospiraceae bacterium]MBK7372707.1 alpha/beta fold hydrolase [Saprospiraceae bacterium]
MVLLSMYLLGFTLIYLVQDRFIFQRQILPADYRFSHDAEEVFIPSSDSVLLNALLFHSAESAKGLILYFHGNRHSLDRWGRYAADLTTLGYDVLMIDYRGYGKSTGYPSEAGLYQDAEATRAWAKEKFPDQPLIYYGRSLGTGVATALAVQHEPQKIILETPYDELKNVVPWYLRVMLYIIPLRHSFHNNDRVPKILCPILILQGTVDPIVPLSSALGLRPLLKPTDQFVIIKGGSHNNLSRFEEKRNALAAFLK